VAAKNNEIGDLLDSVVKSRSLGASRQTVKSPDVQTSSSPAIQQSNIHAQEDTFRSPDVQTSSSPATQKTKGKRKQQTVYLSPGTTKWLRMRAIEEEREISEITEDALAIYKKLQEGE
jgi:hypothetical protein